MHTDSIIDVLEMFAGFGGIALIIWTSAKAKLLHRQQDARERQAQIMQTPFGPAQNAAPQSQDAVLAEVRALSAKVGEMQSTSHQFDLAFDAALERMEGRVARLETKQAAHTADTPAVQRNGVNTSAE